MAGKKSAQLEFPKLDKNGQRRGGKRRGAGRKPANGVKAGASHTARPVVERRTPVHVTLRVVADLGPLRRRHIFEAVRFAMAAVFERDDFHVVHMSIQSGHLHLLVEADDAKALGTGMRSFASTAARFINQAITARTGIERTGRVFADRYHATIMRTPTQARNALRYVVNNWRKHREDRAPMASTAGPSSPTRRCCSRRARRTRACRRGAHVPGCCARVGSEAVASSRSTRYRAPRSSDACGRHGARDEDPGNRTRKKIGTERSCEHSAVRLARRTRGAGLAVWLRAP